MTRRAVKAGAAVASLALVMSGCALFEQDDPADDADAFAAALAKGDLSTIRFTAQRPAQAQRWWKQVRDGMDDSALEVRVETLEEHEDDTATATLAHRWQLARSTARWSYDTKVRLVHRDDLWLVDLQPDAVAPSLTDGERLELSSVPAPRADIIGAGGQRLVTDRPVLRFGIDKTQVPAPAAVESARELAELLDIDATVYAGQVKAAGDRAFVEAIVLRQQDVTTQIAESHKEIPGARAIADTMPLAPTREFARPLLGVVGPVTAEMVEKSKGEYVVGDVAGLSGLQQRYDDQLRGEPGMVVEAVGGRAAGGRALFESNPRPGTPLRVSLDLAMQLQAEQSLADVRPASGLVALRPSTGEILAAASGPGSAGYSTATIGQYAPGSTFKVVTSLALLRAGLAPDDRVSCPSTTVVEGKEFKNYSDYPPSAFGEITLEEAVAQSCNTAFVTQRDRVTSRDVAEAAAALGLGEDHDVGFPSYFGSVPDDSAGTEHAANLIGQGKVLASPMAMAAVAGSVAAARTVVPRLLAGTDVAASAAAPLTAEEAAELQQMMAAVVTRGSGQVLADLPGGRVLAKTGTAEFGEDEPPQTHAWMIAAQGDLAVAVFVEQGESGSRTAGPVLEEFLRGVS